MTIFVFIRLLLGFIVYCVSRFVLQPLFKLYSLPYSSLIFILIINAPVIVFYGDVYIIDTFILFILSTLSLWYLTFKDEYIKSNYPKLFSFIYLLCLITLFHTFLVLFIFLCNFYYRILSRFFSWLKDYVVKMDGSNNNKGGSNASGPSKSPDGGGDPGNNNNEDHLRSL
jgi:hypothetical protein